jgi:NAD+ synthase (glutamine-hydrolysing)
MSFQLCVAQLNFVVGDVRGNAQKIIQSAHQLYQMGGRLLITPELALCGYPAEDLLLRPSFIQACDEALDEVRLALKPYRDLHVVVGHPHGVGQRAKSVAWVQGVNRATVLSEGEVVAFYDKQKLPNYQVFDEQRYFSPGHAPCVFEHAGVKLGLLICEDAWFEAPAKQAAAAGAEVLLVLNASPYHMGKGAEREHAMSERALQTGLPLVYAHLVGAQDEVVFEGGSFAVNAKGEVCARAPSFKECLFEIELSASNAPNHPHPGLGLRGLKAEPLSLEEELWRALVLGVKDYVQKNGFPSVLLGLSGGIDSALVLALAVDALGAQKVHAVMMPSPYTASISVMDANEMARRMGVQYTELSIVPEFEAFKRTLSHLFEGRSEDATEENIQARVRGTLLMAMSNKFGSIVLTTGNKSEMATGYCTLYGDMAGGFAVIKDVCKTMVYRLARWRNEHDPFGTCVAPIPERIITRAPSAELRADQTDQDSLPEYEILDGILARFMEEDQSVKEILDAGYSPEDVAQVTRLIRLNEYKRRQAPLGIRVTHRSFGKDWRYPITNRFHG